MVTPEFLLTSLIVVLIPGTGVIYTVTTALVGGWRAGIAAAIGCTCGIVPHLLASIFGLAALLHISALAFDACKYAGAAYLFYLAWGMWRDTGTLQLESDGATRRGWRIARRGTLINILNPKLSLFFLAFLPQFVDPAAAILPQFVDPAAAILPQLLGLGGLFMAMTLVVFALYALAAHRLRRGVAASPRLKGWLQRSGAALFALLGLKLALAER